MPASPEQFEQDILAELEKHAEAQERGFFTEFIEGRLKRETLREYYKHLYHECTYFVRLVSAVHTFAEHRDQRLAIAQNFLEEYAFGEEGMDHPSLAMHIAKRFDWTEEELEAHQVYPEVVRAYDRLRELALSSYLEGLAALVTVEADLPIRHTMMRQALIDHYGLDPADLRYYDEHRSGGGSSVQDDDGYGGDDVHVAREIAILAKYARTDEDQRRVKRAIAVTFEVRSEIVKAVAARCTVKA
jgi:pyrroloquinoline quinone (PQQ) biosynthesis protein C